MGLAFTPLDWAIVAGYFLIFGLAGVLSARKSDTAADYFLAGQKVSIFLVAVSVISTAQSAGTFLGVPDNSYRNDFTYLASNIGAIIAAVFVAFVLMPRFYALKVATVYELLEHRYDATAKRAAGAMYLVGRVFASGARLYLAAIAVSMIMFGAIGPGPILISSLMLVVVGVAFTLMGGLRSVIWTDLLQVVLYVGAAIAALIYLRSLIPASTEEIVQGLQSAPGGVDKLRVIDTSLDFSAPFTLLAVVTGFALLNIGNFGLDQDTTQRVLSSENAKKGGQALIVSSVIGIPVVIVFLMIGSLLHVFYERPDLMGEAQSAAAREFQGERITVFMHFILSQMPPGLRGLVCVGVLAMAAVNSGLISMSAVLVQDFYRPWKERRGGVTSERHYVWAGRIGNVVLGLALLAMSILCYYWQQYTDMPLLDFVLSVMAFAYSGLLGVYFVALFTNRGSTASVIAAFVTGFLTILLQQAYIVDALGLPPAWKSLAFPWQLCIGTSVAVLTCLIGSKAASARKVAGGRA
jgi:SSS family transporter